VIVTCADCCGAIDISEARGPDGGGNYYCTDLEACDARALDLLEDIGAV
jgi:hypothetical protein